MNLINILKPNVENTEIAIAASRTLFGILLMFAKRLYNVVPMTFGKRTQREPTVSFGHQSNHNTRLQIEG